MNGDLYVLTSNLPDLLPTTKSRLIFLLPSLSIDSDGKEHFEFVKPNHMLNVSQGLSAGKNIFSVKRQLLEDLVPRLNEIHGLKWDNRSWDLVIGFWLEKFITVVFDRWCRLASVDYSSQSAKLKTYKTKLSQVRPQNSFEAEMYFQNEYWNNLLLGRLAQFCERVSPEFIDQDIASKISKTGQKKTSGLSMDFAKRIFWRVINFILKFRAQLKKQGKVIVVQETGLNWIDNLRFLFLLKGTPVLVLPSNLTQNSRPAPLAKKLLLNSSANKFGFDKALQSLIEDCIPESFCNSFSDLKIRNCSVYPAIGANTIFTSHAHFYGDAFKIFAAEQVSKGCALVLGQHGGGAPHKFNPSQNYERRLADRYLAAGFGNQELPKIKYVGQYWSSARKSRFNANGKLLLVLNSMPKYLNEIRSMPSAENHLSYLKDQSTFIKSLSNLVQKETLVRLYDQNYGWNEREALVTASSFPLYFERKGVPFQHSLLDKRLVVCTTITSVFHECLALNIPTVGYWDEEFSQLDETATKSFNELIDVGILHKTPEGAASHVNEIWDVIPNWWMSEEVQTTLSNFCRRYAWRPERQLNQLADHVSGELLPQTA